MGGPNGGQIFGQPQLILNLTDPKGSAVTLRAFMDLARRKRTQILASTPKAGGGVLFVQFPVQDALQLLDYLEASAFFASRAMGIAHRTVGMGNECYSVLKELVVGLKWLPLENQGIPVGYTVEVPPQLVKGDSEPGPLERQTMIVELLERARKAVKVVDDFARGAEHAQDPKPSTENGAGG